ncbi:MAG TPA: putative Ig domain-containing protein, partial [Candidatus Acidoferrales bacterium]|nr:putative Ig domain-containing protein [Candidatus Acidoferrales bacterium]
SGTPPNMTDSPFSIIITASNGLSPSAGQLLTLTVNPTPFAPIITNGPPTAAGIIGKAYSFTYQTSGYPVPTFTLTAGSLPSGLTLSSTGVISGTPTTAGTYTGTVTAGNGVSPNATQNFSITITQPSSITYLAESLSYTASGASTSTQTDTNFNPDIWVELAATGTNQSITYTLPSVPAGIYRLQMEWKGNTNRGQLSLSVDGGSPLSPNPLDQYSANETYPTTTFTPNLTFSSAGTHTVTLTVTGKNAASSGYDLSAFSFILTPVSQNPFPIGYEIQNVGSGLTLSVAGASLTNGAGVVQNPWGNGSTSAEWIFTPTSNDGYFQLINANSGLDAIVQGDSTAAGALIVQGPVGTTGYDQWEPVQNGDGSYTFYNLNSGLVLDDPGSSTSASTQMDQAVATGGVNQEWDIIGQPNITSTNTATFTVGQQGSFTVTATGSPSPTFSASGLPSWATLNSTSGVISGTPSSTSGSPYAVTITASSTGLGSATQNFTLTVQPAPTAPVITNGPATATADVNTAYSFSYTATGYPTPTFSVTSGSLPPGLTLSSGGVISGTPTATGIYTGTVDATNGVSPDATQNFSITVYEPYSQWADLYFNSYQLANPAISGPTATPQSDGVSNLLKYLFDINPSEPMTADDYAALPISGLDTTTTPGITYLTLTYRQNQPITGVTVNIQTSPDMENWTTVTPDITQNVGTDPVTGDPMVEVEVNTADANAEFIRLNVTMP